MGNFFSKKSRLSTGKHVSSMLMTIAAVLFCSVSVKAADEVFYAEGLFFTQIEGTSDEVRVVQNPETIGSDMVYYDGDVIVPAEVSHSGKTYKVTEIGEDAFKYCDNITSISLPEGIISIGEDAFRECTKLTSLTLPSSLKIIKDRAFKYANNLATVENTDNLELVGADAFMGTLWYDNLPEGETYLGKIFYKFISSGNPGTVTLNIKPGTINISAGACNSEADLCKVVIPASVRYIGEKAFLQCFNLADIVIEQPDSLKYLGKTVFNGTEWMEKQPEGPVYIGKIMNTYNGKPQTKTDVVVKDGTEMISDFAFTESNFRGLPNVVSVVLPNSVKEIGENVFKNCRDLKKVVLPEGLKEIKYYTFYNCSALDSLILPKSLESIGKLAFKKSGITYIEIPANVKSYETSFSGCKSLKKIEVAADNEYFCDVDGVMFSKDKKTLIAFPAARTGDYVIPDYVVNIKREAFLKSSLNSVTIPAGLNEIGENVFDESSNLTNVKFTTPSKIKAIRKLAFQYCESLTSVVLPDSLEIIEESAFSDCTSLQDITFPESLRYVCVDSWNGAFEETAWKNNHADGVMYAGKLAMYVKGTTVPSIAIKEGTKYINEYFAIENNSVTDVSLPASVEYIGSEAFNLCTSLETINVLDSAFCSKFPFHRTKWYESQPEGVAYYGKNAVGINDFYAQEPIREVKIKEGTENIAIGNYMYTYDTTLVAVEMPESTKALSKRAFDGYGALRTITVKAVEPPVFEGVAGFTYNVYANANLYVPSESTEAYRNAPYWKNFLHIKGGTTGVESIETADNVRVFANDENIVIEGVDEGTPVEVFNLNGQKIYSGEDTCISVPVKGIYIVVIEGKSYKIIR